jgi:hypothetical protein
MSKSTRTTRPADVRTPSKARKGSAKKRAPRASTASALSQVATALAGMNRPTAILSEPMVGIRNISNYVIGIRSPFQDEPDLQLAAPRYEADEPLREMHDPNMVAQISQKWWMQLRRDKLVVRGMIVRDDSVLSHGATAAPADQPGDLPASHELNAIHDPHDWISTKSEQELKAALAQLTSEESLRRLLTAVNQRVDHERKQLKITDFNEDAALEKKALSNLPWRYKIAEEVLLDRLERDFYGKTA